MTSMTSSWHRSPLGGNDERSNTELFLLIDDGIDDDRVFSIGVTSADVSEGSPDRRPKLRTIRVQRLEGPDEAPVLHGTDINTSSSWSAPLSQFVTVTDLGTYLEVLRDRRDAAGRGWIDDEGSLF